VKPAVLIAQFVLPLAIVALSPDTSAGLPASDAIPGGVAVIPLYRSEFPEPQATFGRKNIRVEEYEGFWWALAGIGLDTIPGEYVISVTANEEPPEVVSFRVKPHPYPLIELPSDTGSRLARLGSILQTRKEKTDSPPEQAVESWQLTVFSSIPLSMPAKGDWEDHFGYTVVEGTGITATEHHLQLTGSENQLVSSPGHALCMAISAAAGGEPDTEPTRFDITLDHGGGLISIIKGVSDLTIQQGDEVQQDAMIGRVKRLPTAPENNLVWVVVLNGEYVNPLPLTVSAEYPVPAENIINFPWMNPVTAAPAPDTR
jgi:hypothetical protein